MASHKVICSKAGCGWSGSRAARTGRCMRCGSAILWASGKKPMAEPFQTCALASELEQFKVDQLKAKLRAAAKAAARSPTPAPPRERGFDVPIDRYDNDPKPSIWPNGRVPLEMRIKTMDTGRVEIIRCPPKRKVKLTGKAKRRAAFTGRQSVNR